MDGRSDFSYERSRLLAAAGALGPPGPPPPSLPQMSALLSPHGYADTAGRLAGGIGRASLAEELARAGTPGLLNHMAAAQFHHSPYLSQSVAMHSAGCELSLMHPLLGSAGTGTSVPPVPADPFKSLAPSMHPLWSPNAAVRQGYPRYGLHTSSAYSPYLSLISASENLPIYSHSVAAGLQPTPSSAYHRIYDLRKEALYNAHNVQGVVSPGQPSLPVGSSMRCASALDSVSHLSNSASAALSGLSAIKHEPGSADRGSRATCDRNNSSGCSRTSTCDRKSHQRFDEAAGGGRTDSPHQSPHRSHRCKENKASEHNSGDTIGNGGHKKPKVKPEQHKVKQEQQRDINSNNKCATQRPEPCCNTTTVKSSGHKGHREKVKVENVLSDGDNRSVDKTSHRNSGSTNTSSMLTHGVVEKKNGPSSSALLQENANTSSSNSSRRERIEIKQEKGVSPSVGRTHADNKRDKTISLSPQLPQDQTASSKCRTVETESDEKTEKHPEEEEATSVQKTVGQQINDHKSFPQTIYQAAVKSEPQIPAKSEDRSSCRTLVESCDHDSKPDVKSRLPEASSTQPTGHHHGDQQSPYPQTHHIKQEDKLIKKEQNLKSSESVHHHSDKCHHGDQDRHDNQRSSSQEIHHVKKEEKDARKEHKNKTSESSYHQGDKGQQSPTLSSPQQSWKSTSSGDKYTDSLKNSDVKSCIIKHTEVHSQSVVTTTVTTTTVVHSASSAAAVLTSSPVSGGSIVMSTSPGGSVYSMYPSMQPLPHYIPDVSKSNEDTKPQSPTYLLPYYQTLYSLSQQGASQEGRKVHATTYTPEVGTLPSMTTGVHTPASGSQTVMAGKMELGSESFLRSCAETRRVSTNSEKAGPSSSKHEGKVKQEKHGRKHSAITCDSMQHQSHDQVNSSPLREPSDSHEGKRKSDSNTDPHSTKMSRVEIKEESTPNTQNTPESNSKTFSTREHSKQQGCNKSSDSRSSSTSSDKKNQDVEDKHRIPKSSSTKSHHKDSSSKHGHNPSRNSSNSSVLSPKEETKHTVTPGGGFMNMDSGMGQFMCSWVESRHHFSTTDSRSVSGGYMLPYPPHGLQQGLEAHSSRLPEMGMMHQHMTRLTEASQNNPSSSTAVNPSSHPVKDDPDKRQVQDRALVSPSGSSECNKNSHSDRGRRNSPEHDITHPTADGGSTSGMNIPVGIAVARKRPESLQACKTEMDNTSDEDSERSIHGSNPWRMPGGHTPHNREPFIREQKGLLAAASKSGSHDVSLGSNLVVTGGCSGGSSVPWRELDSARPMPNPWGLQPGHPLTPALWLGQGHCGLPHPLSGSIDPAHIPVTPPGGYKLVQDPMTGQLYLIPEMVDHGHMWPPYQASVQHLQFLAQTTGRATPQHPPSAMPHHVQNHQLQSVAHHDLIQEDVKPAPNLDKLLSCGSEATSSGHQSASLLPSSHADKAVDNSTVPRAVVDKDKPMPLSATPYLPSIPLATTGQPYPYPYPPPHVPYFYDPSLLPIRGLPISNESVASRSDANTNTRSRGTSPMTVPAARVDRMYPEKCEDTRRDDDNDDCETQEDEKREDFPECTANVEEEDEAELSQVCDVREQSIQTSDQESPPSGLTSPCALEEGCININSNSTEEEDEEDEEGPPHLVAACATPVHVDNPREECPIPDAICAEVRMDLQDITVATQTHTPECTWDTDDVTSEADAQDSGSKSPSLDVTNCEEVVNVSEVKQEEIDNETEEIARLLASMESLKREVALATKIRKQNEAAVCDMKGDSDVMEAADGLSLLSLLAEKQSQLPLGEECKNTTTTAKEATNSIGEGPASPVFSPRHDINKNYPSPFKREFIPSRHFNLKRECGLSPSRCKMIQSADAMEMDAMEIEMRMRLAELQRKYKEKQRELARLQPRRDKDDDKHSSKRGPGRPRKRKHSSKRSSKHERRNKSNSSGTDTSGGHSTDDRQPSHNITPGVSDEPVKKKKKISSTDVIKKNTSSYQSPNKLESKSEHKKSKSDSSGKRKSKTKLMKIKKESRSSDVEKMSPSHSTTSLVKLQPSSLIGSSTSQSEPLDSVTSAAELIGGTTEQVSQPGFITSDMQVKTKPAKSKNKSSKDSKAGSKSPAHVDDSSATKVKSKKSEKGDKQKLEKKTQNKRPLLVETDSDSDLEDVSFLFDEEELNVTKPPKAKKHKIITPDDKWNAFDPANGFDESGLGLLASSAISVAAATSVALKAKKRKQRDETVISKKSKPPKLLPVKQTSSEKVKKPKTKSTTPVTEKPENKPETKSTVCFIDEEWNRRRSERIFLSEPSPPPVFCPKFQPAIPKSQPKSPASQVIAKPKFVAPDWKAKNKSTNVCSTKVKELQSLSQKVKNKYSSKSQSSSKSLVAPSVSSPAKLSSSKPVELKSPSSIKPSVQKQQTAKTPIKTVTSTQPSVSEKHPPSSSLIDSGSDFDSSSDSENDNMPLSMFVERPITPEPRSCVIDKNELVDGLAVLMYMDGLFFEGKVKAIQPPDVYGVVIEGERGNRPHILSQEEILKEAIVDVKPSSQRYLVEGRRICAYWSQQFSCLYPGTVAKGSPNPNADRTLVNVEFDDGDTGKIPIDHIRMLPPDFPVTSTGEELAPLLLVGKRRRRTVSEDLLADVKERKPSVADTYNSYQSFGDFSKSKRGPGRPARKGGKQDEDSKDKPAVEEMPRITEQPEEDVFSKNEEKKPEAKPATTTSTTTAVTTATTTAVTTASSSSASAASEMPVIKKEKKDKKSSKKSHKHKKDKSSGEKSHSKHKHKKHKQKSKEKSKDKKHRHDKDKSQKSTKFHLKESAFTAASKSEKSRSAESGDSKQPITSEKANPPAEGSRSGSKSSDLTVKIRTNSVEFAKPPVLTPSEDSQLSADAVTTETTTSSKSTDTTDRDSLSDSSADEAPAPAPASKSPVKATKKKKTPSKKKRAERLSSGESRTFLPARQLWRWSGKSTKRPGMKGKARKIYYRAITRCKETIKVGDCAVFMSTGRPHLPYVGRIESMWEGWGANMVVRVKWFYHPEETKGTYKLKETKGALFQSSHVDENDVLTISHKCEVLSYQEYKTIRMKEAAKKCDSDSEDVYYLAGSYDPTTGVVVMENDVS